jgi:hypothetical protein
LSGDISQKQLAYVQNEVIQNQIEVCDRSWHFIYDSILGRLMARKNAGCLRVCLADLISIDV